MDLRIIATTYSLGPEEVVVSRVVEHVGSFTRTSSCGIVLDVVCRRTGKLGWGSSHSNLVDIAIETSEVHKVV